MAERLKREVLRPQAANSRFNDGLGVMIVAATAMFFAVASSAFIVRARMHRACTHQHPTPQTPQTSPTVKWTAPVPESPRARPAIAPGADCPGYEVIGQFADGSKHIRFTKCNDARPLRVPVSETPTRDVVAVEVINSSEVIDVR